jgi:hypothetical protein
MIDFSYLFWVHHGFQVSPQVKINWAEIWEPRKPFHRATVTNPGTRKLLIQPLPHADVIMIWWPMMLKICRKFSILV